jgi:hypothetical protein
MSRVDDELEKAQFRGRWSFSVVPQNVPNFQSNSLVYTQVAPWCSRQWTLSLNKMTYQQGVLDPALVAFPLDNQVNASASSYQARVVWGVDGAMETAIVDWPWGGCTICLVAANIRVDVLANLPQEPLPTLSASLSPWPRVQTAIAAPVFTTGVNLAALGGDAKVAVPSRAAAYRFYVAPSSAATAPAAGVLTFQQEDANGNLVKFDGLFADPAGPPGIYRQENQAGYIPLAKDATFVRVISTSSASQQVRIQFLLDMG